MKKNMFLRMGYLATVFGTLMTRIARICTNWLSAAVFGTLMTRIARIGCLATAWGLMGGY